MLFKNSDLIIFQLIKSYNRMTHNDDLSIVSDASFSRIYSLHEIFKIVPDTFIYLHVRTCACSDYITWKIKTWVSASYQFIIWVRVTKAPQHVFASLLYIISWTITDRQICWYLLCRHNVPNSDKRGLNCYKKTLIIMKLYFTRVIFPLILSN